MIIKTHYKLQTQHTRHAKQQPYEHEQSILQEKLIRLLGRRVFEIGKYRIDPQVIEDQETHTFTVVVLHPDRVEAITKALKYIATVEPALKDKTEIIFSEIIGK